MASPCFLLLLTILACGWWLPQRDVEQETLNPRADKQKIKERRKKVTKAFQCAPSHGIR